MRNKACFFAILLLVFSISNFCYAKISPDRIAIGGIYIGASESYVKNLYGYPKEIRREYDKNWDGFVHRYTYGNSLHINFYESNNLAHSVTTTGNTGLSTPDGLKVGSDEYLIQEKYGSPDYVSNGIVSNYNYLSTTGNEKLMISTQNGHITWIGIVAQ